VQPRYQVNQVNMLSNIDFGFYFALFRRRLPLFLAVAVLVASVGIVVTLVWPPSYVATAKILVESPQIPTELAKSTVPTGAAERFQIIQEDVLSRTNVTALAEQFGIFADQPGMSKADIADDMLRRLRVDPVPVQFGGGAATVFHISFSAGDPKVAADLVNVLVGMILNKDVQLRTGRAQDTVAFFDQETERLDAQLRELDSRMLSFKNQNINALPDSLDFRRNQQTAQQQRLLALTQQEASLRKRQSDLRVRPLAPGLAAAATPEEQNLQALRQSLAQQQNMFAEDSPTITALRKRIADAEASIIGQGQGAEGADGPLNARDFELADIADQLAMIEEERASINQSIKDLGASISATPANETALNSLMRDHQNLQAQYDAAIARLADASTGQQIELLLKGERLSVIEQAVPPQTAESPRRKVLLLASVLGALVMGLVAVIIPEFFNHRIRRPQELVSRLGIVPYITVPYVEVKPLRRTRLALQVFMVLAIPALLLAIGTSPVNHFVDQAPTGLVASVSAL
jgi:succinoglycan biosynthesis transport protein ExoP